MSEETLPPSRLPFHTPTCMGCGPDNPHGFQLTVFRDGDSVFSDITFDERHSGAPGLAHGGAVAAVCDDLFGFTLWVAGTPAVTRSLTVDYLQPVPLYQPHRITAHVESRDGRALHVTGAGSSSDGMVRFTAKALFIIVTAEHFGAHGDLTAFSDVFQRLAAISESPGSGDPTP
ncbi:PaaI family thioesterase [Candidatus Mycobacterium wuenschmannii]|uniref:Acyl-coenzyme A thioesterase THEM4 n=1 Tax=Candidatus Mycobacterium wuenschmannii TaxID=3027808 RepID=A0ABY8VT03_9MYCO|nr:PaaI family thioesterase [Candidatus Mycobacterium wuenschmannii]WIM85919.1 PaaI family thioesterase [Candidatus Mycobacterium wuenschmannii]